MNNVPDWHADRQSAIEWARMILQRDDWVIIDTETTGLGVRDEVIQIAVLRPDDQILLETFVKPSIRIPLGATAIHGITDAMVADAPTAATMIELFAAALQSVKTAVIYNWDYDISMLDQTFTTIRRRNPLRAMPEPGHCAMLQYARYVGDWNSYRRSYRWQKLPAIPGQTAHSALADCRSTLLLIQKMAEVLPSCRICGCTDDRACEGGCWWVELDLCSRCGGK